MDLMLVSLVVQKLHLENQIMVSELFLQQHETGGKENQKNEKKIKYLPVVGHPGIQ